MFLISFLIALVPFNLMWLQWGSLGQHKSKYEFWRVLIWHCLLIFFPSKSVPSGACYITGQWERVQNKIRNLTLTITVTLNLLLRSIVFHCKICVFIVTFTALSFLWLIHGLFFIWAEMPVRLYVSFEFLLWFSFWFWM